MAPPKKYRQYFDYTVPLGALYTKSLIDYNVLKVEYIEGTTKFFFLKETDLEKWLQENENQLNNLNKLIGLFGWCASITKKEEATGYLSKLRSPLETLKGMLKSDNNKI